MTDPIVLPDPVLVNPSSVYTTTGTNGTLNYLSRDRTHLIGVGTSPYNRRPAVSHDWGVSWQYGGSNVAGAALTAVIETNDGELLCQVATSPVTMYKTSGWDPADGTFDSATLVLTFNGSPLNWAFTPQAVAPSWSQHNGLIFLAEYGSRLSEVVDDSLAGAHGWVSFDHGATWTLAFDPLNYFDTDDYIHGHLGFADVYNQVAVMAGGDAGASPPGTTWLYWCPFEDLAAGGPWHRIETAFTTGAYAQLLNGLATPSGWVFGSDTTVAAARIARVATLDFRRFGSLVTVAPINTYGPLANTMWQNPEQPDAPIFATSTQSSTASGYPVILASLDGGLSWQEAYRHEVAHTSGAGLRQAMGPNADGKVIATIYTNVESGYIDFDLVPPMQL